MCYNLQVYEIYSCILNWFLKIFFIFLSLNFFIFQRRTSVMVLTLSSFYPINSSCGMSSHVDFSHSFSAYKISLLFLLLSFPIFPLPLPTQPLQPSLSLEGLAGTTALKASRPRSQSWRKEQVNKIHFRLASTTPTLISVDWVGFRINFNGR